MLTFRLGALLGNLARAVNLDLRAGPGDVEVSLDNHI